MLPFHHMVIQTIFHIAAVHLVTDKNTNQLNLIQCNGKLVQKKQKTKKKYIYINYIYIHFWFYVPQKLVLFIIYDKTTKHQCNLKSTSRNREFHLSSRVRHSLIGKAWFKMFHSKSWHTHLIVLSLHIMTESKISSYPTWQPISQSVGILSCVCPSLSFFPSSCFFPFCLSCTDLVPALLTPLLEALTQGFFHVLQ